jgi:hypothetical protein
MDLPEPEHDEALQVVVDNLIAEFPHLDVEVVRSVARDEYDRIAAESKAPSFIGILAERQARDRLDAKA